MAVLITGSAAGRLDPQSGVLLGSFQAGEALIPGPVRLVSGTSLMGAISTSNLIANTSDYLGFVVQPVASGDPVGVYGAGTRIDNFDPSGNRFAGQPLYITATKNVLGDTKVASVDTPVAQALNGYDIVSVR